MRYIFLVLLLTGCSSWNLTLMPIDAGKTYVGKLDYKSNGTGSMSVTIDSITCSGPVAKVGSNESASIGNATGLNSRGVYGSSMLTMFSTGDTFIKGLLTCSNGKGMRCDLSGRDSSGGGICTDDEGRAYDVIATKE